MLLIDSKRVSHHHHLHLAETQMKGRKSGKFYKQKGVYLHGGCWLEEAEGRLTRRGASYITGEEDIFSFSLLVQNWEWGKKMRQAVSSVLTFWGQLLQRLVWLSGHNSSFTVFNQ